MVRLRIRLGIRVRVRVTVRVVHVSVSDMNIIIKMTIVADMGTVMNK